MFGKLSFDVAISYPASSGTLACGLSPRGTAELEFYYRRISAMQAVRGNQSKHSIFFSNSIVSTGNQPLAKGLEESGYEIADVAGVMVIRHPFTQKGWSL